MHELRSKIATGAAWMLLARLIDRSLGIVSTIVLARLLVPSDFGLVAMAMSIIALVELSSLFSFDISLIQKANPTRADYDTAWTLNLVFSAMCAIVIALLSAPASLFYNEPRLMLVMLILAMAWLINGLENIGIVNFRRQMNFSRDLRFQLCKKLPSVVVTILLAVIFQSYWALVAGMVTGRVSGVVLSYVLDPYRPRLCLSARRDLFSFSRWLLLNNILSFASARLSHFMVGRLHGPTPLGIYAISSEIAYLPTTDIVAPINRAVFPGYSRMNNDLDELRRGFIDVVAVIALFAVPLSVGLHVLAAPFVEVVLGNKWHAAVPVIKILALAGGVSAIMSNTYSTYLALGRPSVLTYVKIGELAVLIPGMFLLSHFYGVIGVAYAELLAILMGLFISYPLLFKTLNLTVLAYLERVIRPIVSSLVMAFLLIALSLHLAVAVDGLLPILTLILLSTAGAVAYIAALFLLWLLSGRPIGAETMLARRMASMVARARSVREVSD